MEKSESIKQLATALAKFQGEMEGITKDATNPFFKSKYASLSVIIEDTRKPLSKNGLSFSQFPSGENGLVTILMHASGEWISEVYYTQPVDNRPQSLGSAITYLRRYAITAILGLQVEDDDGNEASGKRPPPAKAAYQKYTKPPRSYDENAEGAVITLDDEEPPKLTVAEQKAKIFALLRDKHGVDIKSKKACEQFVADATQLALGNEKNYEDIIIKLSE